jgi:imidazoleglycerol-phosphate dehydratase/histidinol-phosphatase
MSNTIQIKKAVADISGIIPETGMPDQKNFLRACILLSEKGYGILYDGRNELVKQLLKNESVSFVSESVCPPQKGMVILNTDGTEQSLPAAGKNSFYHFAVELPSLINQRKASLRRTTKETDISIEVNLDSPGRSEISTGLGFFDHMLDQISRHGNISLVIYAKGDMHIDEHHTVEDTGLALGEAILNALGDKKGIRRYGFLLPMDDSVTELGIDFGGRPLLNFNCRFRREKVGDFPTELTAEFFRALSVSMKANIYIRTTGSNDHHKIESIFKAFGKALNDAVRIDPRAGGMLPSTKGTL